MISVMLMFINVHARRYVSESTWDHVSDKLRVNVRQNISIQIARRIKNKLEGNK